MSLNCFSQTRVFRAKKIANNKLAFLALYWMFPEHLLSVLMPSTCMLQTVNFRFWTVQFMLLQTQKRDFIGKFFKNDTVGCIFPMVISSEFRMDQHRDDDHREDAPHFINCSKNQNLKKLYLRFYNFFRFWFLELIFP